MADLTGANGTREEFKVVGKSNIPGLTSYAMATGIAKYGSDYIFPGMLYAKILRSPYAHARVLSIDPTEAWKIDGVEDVVLWDDPDFEELGANPYANGPQPHYLMDEAQYEGQEIGAVVVARSESICEEALKALKIEWEVLPVISNITQGLDPNIPNIRGEKWLAYEEADYEPLPFWETRSGYKLMTRHYPDDPRRKGNVSFNNKIDGDMEKGWRESDFTIEFDINMQDLASTMPNPPASVAYWENNMYPGPKKKIHIEGAVHWGPAAIMGLYKMPPEGIIQHGVFQGGRYCDWGTRMAQEITPLLSRRMGGKPVRCCNTREESFDLYRMERRSHVTMGVTNDGLITAVKDDILVDNGAPNTAVSGTTAPRDWGGYYTLKCKNIAQLHTIVDTNRGYMPCSSQFVPFNWDTITKAFYLISEKLDKDPVEIARLNLHGPSSQDDPNPVPSFEACLEKGRELMNWQWHKARTKRLPDGRWHGASFRYAMCPRHDFIEWYCKLEYRDGAIHFPTQGPITGFFGTECYTMIIAEELGIGFDDVCVDYDSRAKHSDGAGGTDGVTGQGWIVKECANKLKRKILEAAVREANNDEVVPYGPFTRYVGISPLKGCTPDELDIVDGDIIVKSDPDRSIPLSKATPECLTAEYTGHSPEAAWGKGYGRILDTMNTSWCEVAVDEGTGEVEILKYLIVPDVGKAIRMTSLESQIDQAVFFSQGAQLLEELILDPETGVRLNGNFVDYRVPTTLDVPAVDKQILELRSGNGSYGGSGISHNLANSHHIMTAIHNAVGVWLDPPATPDRLLKAIKQAKREGKI